MKRKYGLVGEASAMLLFVKKNNVQGRTKMVEDGIMDKRRRRFQRNGTDPEEVAFRNKEIIHAGNYTIVSVSPTIEPWTAAA